MKKLSLSCVLLLAYAFVQAQTLNVMTFNIRYNNAADSANAWPFRKDKVASQILFHDVDLLGVQEALHGQLEDLQQRLPSYKYVGVGRTDGEQKGEYSALFFDTARLQLLHSETFWLSQQPTVAGSKGWDAAITRVVTWAQFKDLKTNLKFYAFNTHFDHMGKVARRESANLLLQKIESFAGKNPVIVTGDFNASPADEPIQLITDSNNLHHLTDSKAISATPHYGPSGTFNGFQQKEVNDEPIDYIFVKNGVKVLKHATLSQSWNGLFSSDHFPVFAKLQL
jgi:endonuclease/exonuclease/phosphatase family metal-dependent hydrolase